MKSESTLTPEVLASIELYRDMPAAALADVIACARMQTLSKGARIFVQGDVACRAYALIDGRVRISQSGSDGEQVIIRFIRSGEIFGAFALFTDRRYPVEAVAVGESLGVSWNEADLRELMRRYPAIATNLVRIIGYRLQEVQERVRELATQSAERRVAHTLLRLARQASKRTDIGTEIDFPLTRKHLAEMAGTTLHTASRILTHWEKSGWVVTEHQRVTLRHPAEISRIAESAAD